MFHYEIKVPVILFNAIFDDLKDIYDRIDHERINFKHRSDTYDKMRYLSIYGENFKQVPHFFDFLIHYDASLNYIFLIRLRRMLKFIHFSAVNEVKAAINKVIDGYTIKCRDGERIDGIELPCHKLLTK